MFDDCELQSLDNFIELIPMDGQTDLKTTFAEDGEIISSDDGSLFETDLKQSSPPKQPDESTETKSCLLEDLNASVSKKDKKAKKKAKKELKKLKKKRKELLGNVGEFSDDSDPEFGVAVRKKRKSREKVGKKRKISFEEDSHDELFDHPVRYDFDVGGYIDLDQQYSDDSESDLRIRLEIKRRRRLRPVDLPDIPVSGSSLGDFRFRRGNLKSPSSEKFSKKCAYLRKGMKEKVKKSAEKDRSYETVENSERKSKSASKSKSTKSPKKHSRRASVDIVAISSDSDADMDMVDNGSSMSTGSNHGVPFDYLLQNNFDGLFAGVPKLNRTNAYHSLHNSCDWQSQSSLDTGPSACSRVEPPETTHLYPQYDMIAETTSCHPQESTSYQKQQCIYSSIKAPSNNHRRLAPKPNSVDAPHLGYIVENGWANLDELMNQFVDKQLKSLQQSLKSEPNSVVMNDEPCGTAIKTENIEDMTGPSSSRLPEESIENRGSLTAIVPCIVKSEFEESPMNGKASERSQVVNHMSVPMIKDEPIDYFSPDPFLHDRNSNVCVKQGFVNSGEFRAEMPLKVEVSHDDIENRSFAQCEEFDVDLELDARLNSATVCQRSSRSPGVSTRYSEDMSRSSTPDSFASFRSFDSSKGMHYHISKSFDDTESITEPVALPTESSSFGHVEITLDKPSDYISSDLRCDALLDGSHDKHALFGANPGELRVQDKQPKENAEKHESDTRTMRNATLKPTKRNLDSDLRSHDPRKLSKDSESSNHPKISTSEHPEVSIPIKPASQGTEPSEFSLEEIPENIRSLFASSDSEGRVGSGASSVDILSKLSSRISGETIDSQPKVRKTVGTYEFASKNAKVKKAASKQISVSGIPDPRLLSSNRKKCASKFESRFAKLTYWCKQVFMERTRGSLSNLLPIELLPDDRTVGSHHVIEPNHLSLLAEKPNPSETVIPNSSHIHRREQAAREIEPRNQHPSSRSDPSVNRNRKEVRMIPVERADGVAWAADPRLEHSHYPINNRPVTVLQPVEFSIDELLISPRPNFIPSSPTELWFPEGPAFHGDNTMDSFVNQNVREEQQQFDYMYNVPDHEMTLDPKSAVEKNEMPPLHLNPTHRANENFISPASGRHLSDIAPSDPRLRTHRSTLISPPKLTPAPSLINSEEIKATTDFDYRSSTTDFDHRSRTTDFDHRSTTTDVDYRSLLPQVSENQVEAASLPLLTRTVHNENHRPNLLVGAQNCNDVVASSHSTGLDPVMIATNCSDYHLNGDDRRSSLPSENQEWVRDWKRLGYVRKKPSKHVRVLSGTSGYQPVDSQGTSNPESTQNVRPVSSLSTFKVAVPPKETAIDTSVTSEEPTVVNDKSVSSLKNCVEERTADSNFELSTEAPKPAPARRKKNPLMPEFD